jgi:short-subunit dehydrogenase
MNKPLVVLVTGATTGIGRHAALYLARAGHHVIATGRKEALLDSLKAEAEGARLDVVRLDVTDGASIEVAVVEIDRITDGHGIDALVNNAGYGQAGPIEELTDAQLRAQFDTNVFGAMAVTRAFLPKMRARAFGRLINVSSIGGRVTFPLLGAYHASKYALEALSDAMRLELRPFGVEVVLVEPGPIQSEFSDRAFDSVRADGQTESPYAAAYAKADALKKQTDSQAASPIVVSRAIERAITARRPRARYVVPFAGSVLIAMFRLLPTRWMDGLLAIFTGLTRKNLVPTPRATTPALT